MAMPCMGTQKRLPWPILQKSCRTVMDRSNVRNHISSSYEDGMSSYSKVMLMLPAHSHGLVVIAHFSAEVLSKPSTSNTWTSTIPQGRPFEYLCGSMKLDSHRYIPDEASLLVSKFRRPAGYLRVWKANLQSGKMQAHGNNLASIS